MTYETLERMVNEHLSAYVDSLGEIPATLRESMLYSLEAGGKRRGPPPGCRFSGWSAAGGCNPCAALCLRPGNDSYL